MPDKPLLNLTPCIPLSTSVERGTKGERYEAYKIMLQSTRVGGSIFKETV